VVRNDLTSPHDRLGNPMMEVLMGKSMGKSMGNYGKTIYKL
jgi:hypothetical protein